MLRKLFARREDDRHREEVIDGIYRSAIGDLGPQNSMLLALYCVCAIAGHVVQQVKLADRITKGLPQEPPYVVPVVTSGGRTYVFGEAIAGSLIANDDGPGILRWLADQVRLPWNSDVVGIWLARSAETVGKDEYGAPSSPFDKLNWPSIDAVINNTDEVVNYLVSGGLDPSQFESILTNAARLALLRAVDECRLWSSSQLVQLGSEAAIAGSHIVPVGSAES